MLMHLPSHSRRAKFIWKRPWTCHPSNLSPTNQPPDRMKTLLPPTPSPYHNPWSSPITCQLTPFCGNGIMTQQPSWLVESLLTTELHTSDPKIANLPTSQLLFFPNAKFLWGIFVGEFMQLNFCHQFNAAKSIPKHFTTTSISSLN